MIRLVASEMRPRELLASVSDPGPGQPLLLVDPDASSRGRMYRVLTGNGFAVTCAATAEAALAAAAAARFGHAVVELRVPDGCGIVLIGQLRARNEAMRIVVLTGHASFATVVVALRSGASDYLAKPAGAEELIEALAGTAPEEPPIPDLPLGLDRIEWEYVQRLFQQCGRNVTRTAQRLGMHRRTLQRMLAKRAPAPRCSHTC
jgi:two-component system response regulator RegA